MGQAARAHYSHVVGFERLVVRTAGEVYKKMCWQSPRDLERTVLPLTSEASSQNDRLATHLRVS